MASGRTNRSLEIRLLAVLGVGENRYRYGYGRPQPTQVLSRP